MWKSLYKIIFIFWIILSGIIYGAPAPGNAIIGTQAQVTYTNTNNIETVVDSNIVIVKINEIRSISLNPKITNYSASPGENIFFPIKISNTGNIEDTYKVYLETNGTLKNISFTVDKNKNGIIDGDENIILKSFDNLPILGAGEDIYLIVKGEILSTTLIGSIQKYIFHGQSINNTEIKEESINNFLIADVADIEVIKKFGEIQGNELTYILEIYNKSETPGTTLVIKDILPEEVDLEGTFGEWIPFGEQNKKNVTYVDDGIELLDNNIQLKVLDKVLTLTVSNIPGNFIQDSSGGKLFFKAKIKGEVEKGRKIVNIAGYNYNNGRAITTLKNTNILTYEIPNVNEGVNILEDMEIKGVVGDYITIGQRIINIGKTSEEYNLSVENGNFLENIEFYLDKNGDGIKNQEDILITKTPILKGGESINILFCGRIKNDTPIEVKTFEIYGRGSNSPVEDFSQIKVNILEREEFIDIYKDESIGTKAGEVINFTQTIENKGEESSYYLDIENGEKILNVKFYSDENRTMELEKPFSLSKNEKKKIFITGEVANDISEKEDYIFRIFVRDIYKNINIDWSTITLTFRKKGEINIIKGIENTDIPGAFIYTFDFTNIGEEGGSEIILKDNFPEGVIPDSFTGIWYPTGGGSLPITIEDDGPEANSSDIRFKIINGVMEFKLEHLIPGGTPRLAIRVRNISGVTPGSVLVNKGEYSYSDGENIIEKETNSVDYKVPSQALVGIEKNALIDLENPGQFLYRFKIINTGDVPGKDIKLVDILPGEVDIIGNSGIWIPIGSTEEENLTYEDDGLEGNNRNVTLKVINGILTFTLDSISERTLENSQGGELYIEVKPKEEIIPGTIIENKGTFQYNNGYDGIVMGRSTNKADYRVPVTPLANVEVIKKIGESNIPGGFTYVFEIINTGGISGKNLVINDTFPEEVNIKDNKGFWKNFGSETLIEDDVPGITFSITNGIFTGSVEDIPPGIEIGDIGGEFIINVVPKVTVGSGTEIENKGKYSYEDGRGNIINKDTVIAKYIVPSQGIVNVEKGVVIDPEDFSQFIYTFKITNVGNIPGKSFVLKDTFSENIEIVSTEGLWKDFLTGNLNNLTLENDGQENTNGNVNLEVINGEMVFKIENIPENIDGTLPGGELALVFKGKDGVPNGTVIENMGIFEYDNGRGNIIKDIKTNLVTYALINEEGPNVVVEKNIGESENPGAFTYIFDFKNNGREKAKNIILRDKLPEGIIPDKTYGIFIDSISGNITNADDGKELPHPEIEYKLINGEIELKIEDLNVDESGKFILEVRPRGGVIPGTILKNKGEYTYTSMDETGEIKKETNTVIYTVPSQALVGIEKSAVEDGENRSNFVYKFKIFNSGDLEGKDIELIDNLGNEVEVVGNEGIWIPVNETEKKIVTIEDDGPEVEDTNVNLKIIDGVVTFKLNKIEKNILQNGVGGILELKVRGKMGVMGGTTIINTGEFSYNNGYDGVVLGEKTNTVTYTLPEGAPILILEKYQKLGDIYVKDPIEIKPGEIIEYKLVVTNRGTGIGTNIEIGDTFPEFTKINYGDGTIGENGKPSWRIVGQEFQEVIDKPNEGDKGRITLLIPRLIPGE
ncbi:MAG: hypothetical protein MJH09_10310, partial [Cetobacterium sp.]|nr:hypothetical protein [Cetobacterium sp.]